MEGREEEPIYEMFLSFLPPTGTCVRLKNRNWLVSGVELLAEEDLVHVWLMPRDPDR